jgi:hypothetical protein
MGVRAARTLKERFGAGHTALLRRIGAMAAYFCRCRPNVLAICVLFAGNAAFGAS